VKVRVKTRETIAGPFGTTMWARWSVPGFEDSPGAKVVEPFGLKMVVALRDGRHDSADLIVGVW